MNADELAALRAENAELRVALRDFMDGKCTDTDCRTLLARLEGK